MHGQHSSEQESIKHPPAVKDLAVQKGSISVLLRPKEYWANRLGSMEPDPNSSSEIQEWEEKLHALAFTCGFREESERRNFVALLKATLPPKPVSSDKPKRGRPPNPRPAADIVLEGPKKKGPPNRSRETYEALRHVDYSEVSIDDPEAIHTAMRFVGAYQSLRKAGVDTNALPGAEKAKAARAKIQAYSRMRKRLGGPDCR